jgi:DNA-binding response OmpR family regulator
VESRSLDNLVFKLRGKLADIGGRDAVMSVRSIGYQFCGFPRVGG